MSVRTVRVLSLASVVLIAACASQPASERALAPEPHDPHCLRETGTRIEVAEGKCAPGRGRSITREELEQTGGVNLSDRLSRLVPF